MGVLEGRVAVVTGAARGQGRAHAVRLAAEGADVVALDICDHIPSVPYPLASRADLEETANAVRSHGRRVVALPVDVRDSAGVREAIETATEQLGPARIVVANAGILSYGRTWELTDEQWHSVLDVNLTGTWQTVRATVPSMLAAGNGGSIVIISSTAGLRGMPFIGHYVATKHALVGLMRTLAIELAPHRIRVNAVHPTGVSTPMVADPAPVQKVQSEHPEVAQIYGETLLPVNYVTPEDVTEAVVWLGSDASRYVTGISLPVDAGSQLR